MCIKILVFSFLNQAAQHTKKLTIQQFIKDISHGFGALKEAVRHVLHRLHRLKVQILYLGRSQETCDEKFTILSIVWETAWNEISGDGREMNPGWSLTLIRKQKAAERSGICQQNMKQKGWREFTFIRNADVTRPHTKL